MEYTQHLHDSVICIDTEEHNLQWWLDIYERYYAAESNEQAEASDLDEQSPATADCDVSVTTQP
jgi:hypothetical protein